MILEAEEGGKVPDIRNLHIIIEIMSFERKGVKKVFSTLGWTICKVMTPNLFIESGIY